MSLIATALAQLSVLDAEAQVVTNTNSPAPGEIRIVSLAGQVEISPKGAAAWIPIQSPQPVHPFDRVRTGPNSRITLLWADQSVVTFDALTDLEIQPPQSAQSESGLHFIKGIFSFFHRDKPSRIRVITSGAVAGIEGTEFVMEVDQGPNGERTTLSVIDGRVQFKNRFGNQLELVLTNGRQAVVEGGQAPVYTAGFIANNLLQWCFYYPAVLDLGDMSLSAAEQADLTNSLKAYRDGDLLAALAMYPTNRTSVSTGESLYHAALLLSVGQAAQTEKELARLESANANERISRLVGALRTLIVAVKLETNPPTIDPQLPTELLAASYFAQSRGVRDTSLAEALDLARRATTNSPQFGFAWARVAELEFSFGRTGRALENLNKSLELSPRNAEALSLKGFLLAAQNRPGQAIGWFNKALEVDPSLGNAWLGRGLCRIRCGDTKGGREDLLVAAALEPQRSVLRSYLGKAYGSEGDFKRADKELALAKKLDPNDPTPWLYSALLKQQENRVNEGIRDLETSQDLNTNRSVFRSSFLLDQDQAVRSANLALLYADADLRDVSVREANRAVVDDYANYSAHLFLANSFEAQRRASISDLRFEAPAVSEYTIVNLLGPANGRLLTQPVSQLEYSKLFESDGLGLIANTEYFSRGAWRFSGAQYGNFGGSSYSLEGDYFLEPGERPNQDLEIRQLEAKFKQDITPNDSVFFDIVDYRENGGNIEQSFNAIPTELRFDLKQAPTVFLGYHHQWSPEQHTLVIAGRFDDTFQSFDPFSNVYALDLGSGITNGLVAVQAADRYQSHLVLYSVEAQQIALIGRQTFIAGARFQWSDKDAAQTVSDPNGPFLVIMGFANPISVQSISASSFTASAYIYDYLKVTDAFRLVGGLNFTHQDIPVNTVSAPITSEQHIQERLSPKAGFIWAPSDCSTVRAAYTRSLTGYDLGQSLRIEPTQVAGLLQTFRDPIPPALVGGLDGVDVETAEAVWEGHFADTYLALGYQYLAGKKTAQYGLYLSSEDYIDGPTFGLVRKSFDFHEHGMNFSAHQLIGKELSLGIGYRLAFDELEQSFPEYQPSLFVPPPYGIPQTLRSQALLHTVNLSALYRHHSGLFGRVEAVWYSQDREQMRLDRAGRASGSLPGDQFWQVNLLGGYRFWRGRAEVTVGLLNATGQDYRLDPLNPYAELPRSRTFYTRLLLNF
jgi:tetratricopeptide (TPR) repeat protein